MQVASHLNQIDEVVENIGEASYHGYLLSQVLLNYNQVKIGDCEEVVDALLGVGFNNSFQMKLDLDISS